MSVMLEKKNEGMTIAQESKECRGNGINLCSVYPANNPNIYVHYCRPIARGGGFD